MNAFGLAPLLLVMPVIGVLFNIFAGRKLVAGDPRTGERISGWFATSMTLTNFVIAVLLFLSLMANGHHAQPIPLWTWFNIPSASFYIPAAIGLRGLGVLRADLRAWVLCLIAAAASFGAYAIAVWAMTVAPIALVAALPFLPVSYTERMATITEFRADQSASTRVQVWAWTYEYVKANPLGGGFDAYIGNSFTYETREGKELGNTQVIESREISEKSRAYHSAYFELLGEQGWVGLGLWLWLQLAGLWQMERIQRKLKDSNRAEDKRWRSLAIALQQGQVIYLVGAVFIGVGYQPFMFKLLGLQIALSIILQRQWKRKEEGDQPPAISAKAQAPA